MSTGKPSRTAASTEHEAAHIERANASGRTDHVPGLRLAANITCAEYLIDGGLIKATWDPRLPADEPTVHATGARRHPSWW